MSTEASSQGEALAAAEIIALLEQNARQRPEETAVMDHEGHATSWHDLLARAEAIREQLSSQEDGGPVVVVGDNSAGFVAAFYGVLLSGRVVIPAMVITPESELSRMADAVGANTTIVVPPLGRLAPEPNPTTWKIRVTSEGVLQEGALGAAESHEVEIRSGPELPAESIMVCFTSGSTGLPKAAVHSQKSILLGARTYVRDVLGGEPRPILCTLPLSHAGGISVTLVAALTASSPLVVFGSFSVPAFVAATGVATGQVAMLVPPMVKLMVREGVSPLPEANVAVTVLSGSPVDVETALLAKEMLRCEIRVGMGMSECPGCFLLTPPGRSTASLERVLGTTSKGFETRVEYVDELEPDATARHSMGELLVRASEPILGYLQSDGAMSSVGREDGWIPTGDLVTEDETGCYVLRGRRKEMYIHGGYNVFPAEVEASISRFPGVLEAAVHSVPDSVMGENGQAWVVVDSATFDLEKLRVHLADDLARYKVPAHIDLIAELPRNSVGKVDKIDLARRASTEKKQG